jgi:membrane fusion protein, multidrug efflux system
VPENSRDVAPERSAGTAPAGRAARLALRALLIAAVVAVAAAPKIWSELVESAPASAATTVSSAPRREAPLRVAAVAVRPAPLAEVVTSSGTLIAAEAVELQAEVSGKITSIAFSEGAAVRAGTLLVKLNDADLQARRSAAKHELSLAERRERRAAELVAQGFVIQDDHDGALNTVQVRRAEIALIEAQIAKTEIRAPFDGVAGLRYVSLGAFVGATTRIATLQRTDTLKVDFAVPERYADRIRIGSAIGFTVDGHAREFGGHVYAYDPRIDPETRTLLLRAECPNPGGVLLPGAFANVKLELAVTEDAVLIPAEALIPDFEATYVFVAASSKAERRRVETGMRTADAVQIVSGLAAGDVVITSGIQQLRDGAPVEATLASADAVGWHHAAAPPGRADHPGGSGHQ